MPKKRYSGTKKGRKRNIFRRVLRFVIIVIVVMFLLSVAVVVAYKYLPVRITPLMVKRSVESVLRGDPVVNRKEWVDIDRISYEFALACVASEDNLFLTHNGFSKRGITQAVDDYRKGKRLRGGSTISQQTAKNVFTFGERSWFRKGVEAYFTVLIELVWGKERILEVYMNVVELGSGIYGIEAAARQYFGVPAVLVNRSQAALLAAALPNPRVYSVIHPGPYMQRRQRQIVALMPKMQPLPFFAVNKKKAAGVSKK